MKLDITIRYARSCCALILLGSMIPSALAADMGLIEAVKHRDQTAVKTLLQKHSDVNVREADGSTALAWAVDRDDAALVDLLLKAGANVNLANDYGATPL